MTSRLKFFLIAFILSLPFFWGVNIFEENSKYFLYSYGTAEINPEIKFENFKPVLKENSQNFEIDAKSAISLFVGKNGRRQIVFEKNSDQLMPIASLTKIFAAFLILEYYNLDEVIQISKDAEKQPGQPQTETENTEKLKAGENFKVKDLLYTMLLESNNTATFALSQRIGQEKFVNLMNSEIKNLGLDNTYFYNSTGLDQNPYNYSTATDLANFARFSLTAKSGLWPILSTKEFDLFTAEGVFHHKVINTNKLLSDWQDFENKIIGGKTGDTPEAGECLLFAVSAPENRGYLINVILNSNDRFEQIKKLISWVNNEYLWQ